MIALLTRAKGLIARGWCCGDDAKDDEGEPCDPCEAGAKYWSVGGAIALALHEMRGGRVAIVPHNERFRHLSTVVNLALVMVTFKALLFLKTSVVSYNDNPQQRSALIRLDLEEAIARLRKIPPAIFTVVALDPPL